MPFDRILIYGFGTMSAAMLDGWLASGIEAERFAVFNPRPKPVPRGICFTALPPDGNFDAVVLGFKPQMLGAAAHAVAPLCGGGTAVLSILAGADLASLRGHFPHAGGVVRFMPNLAAAIGKSPVALISSGLGRETRAAVTDLAERLGSAEWIAEEDQFDAVTALAGSGPGFVYRFIDALAGAACELGLPADQAGRLAIAMAEGAAALAAASPHDPAALADRVASPGGMTRAGLGVLDDGDALARLLAKTLRAARDRGREMAEKAG